MSAGEAPRIERDLWRRHRDAGVPRVVVVGLLFRDGRLLVEEFQDGKSGQVLCRPPGGGVRFGERLAVALAREFQEELSVDITVGPLFGAYEDLFVHEGNTGHELVFAYRVTASGDVSRGFDNGRPMRLRWLDVTDPAPTLCPSGLAAALAHGLPEG